MSVKGTLDLQQLGVTAEIMHTWVFLQNWKMVTVTLCTRQHVAVKKMIGEMCIKTERELRNTQTIKQKDFDDK